MYRLAAASLLIAVATPAWAQSRPIPFPTRDVTVTYQTQNGHEMTMAYGAAARRIRISGMGAPGGYAVVERDGNQMFIVVPQRHMVMRMTEPPAMRAALTMYAFSGFARAGMATVAGVSCAVWNVRSSRGDGDVCVTADGVLLRARRVAPGGAPQTMMQATKVDYHALPAGDFKAPAGYRTMTMPPMPQGGGAMPGGLPPQPQH